LLFASPFSSPPSSSTLFSFCSIDPAIPDVPRVDMQVIHLRSGYHVLDEPLRLGAEHSNMHIVAHQGERAVVCACMPWRLGRTPWPYPGSNTRQQWWQSTQAACSHRSWFVLGAYAGVMVSCMVYNNARSAQSGKRRRSSPGSPLVPDREARRVGM
jgi:hypothetical protein